MHVYTFRAESLQAALQQVRDALGPDASVLHTREKRRGRMGLFARTFIEVEATAVDAAQTVASRAQSLPPISKADIARASAGALDLASVGEVVEAPLAGGSLETPSPAMLEVQADLLSSGISPSVVAALMREVAEQGRGDQAADAVEDPWVLRGRIGQRIAMRLKVAGSIELSGNKPQVVALVGPTGVGKTTTLAKIAAGFRFDLGCRIGLIALDTFRLGAVDQLLQYAELVSAPLEVVSSSEQVTAALERLSDCDLVLLDTAGRAPRDSEQLAELHRFLQLAQPHSTQLVVSAASSPAYVAQTIERFSVLTPTNLLITKLDEAVEFGSWLAMLERTPLSISYLTHGQQVPQDIMVASARRLCSLLLGQPQSHFVGS